MKNMEKWDLYTRNREKTGREHVRGEKIPEGFYHLVVHIWIRNCKGEYLISQRSANRPTSPLMWECVGGSVLIGESSIDGAHREVKEEVGLDLEPETGKILFTKIRSTFNDIVDVWPFEYDGDLHLDDATTDEVSDCRWMTVSEIRKLYEDNRLVQTLDYFFCAMEADQNSSLS
ncbi:MAG: NUDIX domain-containing protein [Clostridia bacterium]|nr:NUDIX domain-containing protein [Clostridia bacterium]